MDKLFLEKIEKFFSVCEFKDTLTISFVRDDGIVLFSNFPNELDGRSIGALVGGVWQAAKSLASFASDQESLDFRFSYDTSSDGITILPLKYGSHHFFLCGIYKEEMNPAVLKQKLRVLQGKLERFILEQSEQNQDNRSGYLFDYITDEEMDNLFSVTGI
jgi:hypothetical protein